MARTTPEENRAKASTDPDFDMWQWSRDVERYGLAARLGGSAYATLRTIAGHVNVKPKNPRYGKAWLGEDTLAAEVGFSERQIREHIKKLVQHQLIAIHKEKGRCGNRNEYVLLPLATATVPTPTKPANLPQLLELNRRRAAGLQNGERPPVYNDDKTATARRFKNGESPPLKTATARRFKPATARRLQRRAPAAEVPIVGPQRKCLDDAWS